MNSIVFVGGGRITSALLAGLRLARFKAPIIMHDRHATKLRVLKRRYGVQVESDLQAAVARAGLLVIAVRPEAAADLAEQIQPISRTLSAISLAAGIPMSLLRARMGPPVRWARAMPSPVCRIGRGLTAVTFARNFPVAARRRVLGLFRAVGAVLEIPESKFDAFTVTYSSSHGYHALAALAEAAEKVGLDRRSALAAASHALADGVAAWREGSLSLNHLLHEAATPGGVAAAVMESMNANGYREAVQRGLIAGMKRAKQNAK